MFDFKKLIALLVSAVTVLYSATSMLPQIISNGDMTGMAKVIAIILVFLFVCLVVGGAITILWKTGGCLISCVVFLLSILVAFWILLALAHSWPDIWQRISSFDFSLPFNF